MLFRDSERLAAVRLRPHHRSRATILEVEPGPGGRPVRIVFGIVRHPKSHPLAARGEDVLELIEYEPPGAPRVLLGRNLDRRGRRPASDERAADRAPRV